MSRETKGFDSIRTDSLRILSAGAAGLAFCWLASLAAGCSDSSAPKQEARDFRGPSETGGQPAKGLWQRSRKAPTRTPAQTAEFEALSAIGYSDGYNPASEFTQVTLHDTEHAFEGLNFYTSGHDLEALLIGMDGQLLHRWKTSTEAIWPGRDIDPNLVHSQYFRRAALLPTGEILAIVANFGLVKLGVHSEVIWVYDAMAHHDVRVLDDGRILLLTREVHMRPAINPELPVMEDFAVILTSDGQLLQRISLLDALLDAGPKFSKFRTEVPSDGDLLHTNSVELLDGRMAHNNPTFAAGNLLVSYHRTSVIAVVDWNREQVVWAKHGRWKNQHDPRVLDDRRLLIFNNIAGSKPWGKFSSVIEYDVVEDDVVWNFRGVKGVPFQTTSLGAAHRLPNGNTLIIESEFGRAFEVTSDKRKVWVFFNPHRAGKNDEFVAVLLDMERLPPDFPTDWIPQ